MTDLLSAPCTAFDGDRLLAGGPLTAVAEAVKHATDAGKAGPVLVFDDRTGTVIDLDLRGSLDAVLARLPELAARLAPKGPASEPADTDSPESTGPRGKGRPRLGVVAHEVTLLPRHWDWLGAQPGGASAALRRLVDAARRDGASALAERQAREAAYRFMAAMAGDQPGYEEATRALFAGDRARLASCMADWPPDLRGHALRLAVPPDV